MRDIWLVLFAIVAGIIGSAVVIPLGRLYDRIPSKWMGEVTGFIVPLLYGVNLIILGFIPLIITELWIKTKIFYGVAWWIAFDVGALITSIEVLANIKRANKGAK